MLGYFRRFPAGAEASQEDPSPQPATSGGHGAIAVKLLAFLNLYALGLRARVELFEQILTNVLDHHGRGIAFRNLAAERISVDYEAGQLAIWLSECQPVGFPQPAPGIPASRFDGGHIAQAANVVQAGHLLIDMLRDCLHHDREIWEICERARSCSRYQRLTGIAELQQLIQTWLVHYGEANGELTDSPSSLSRMAHVMRWSWA